MSNLISVIMPVYNAEPFLPEAIDSILNQTYKNFEFIIINDGSTDRSEEIIMSYIDSRIVYLKNDSNLKLIKTLNKGIMAARGKYIARMDADDVAINNLFAREVEVFEQNKNVDIVNVLTYNLSEDGTILRPNRARPCISSEAMTFINVFQNLITHPGVMVKAELMKEYQYLDDGTVVHFEDYDLWNRMFADGKYCHTINERLIKYRLSSTSINATQSAKRWDHIVNYTEKYISARFDYMFPDSFWRAYRNSESINAQILIFNNLKKYINWIINNNRISSRGQKELYKWLTNFMLFNAKCYFQNENFVNKMLTVPWFSYLVCLHFINNFE
ncbi:MAG: glycosyltransferase family A protein [Negativicutes bacterium]|nr:glycosyltransferase family A protein [Negativicutes bacterium]